MNSTTPATHRLKLAVPFLGILAAVQSSAPFMSSTALVSVTKDLGLSKGEIALAASMLTLAIAATVITTGLLADRLGRKLVLMAALVVSASGFVIVALSPVALIYLAGQAVIGVGLGAVYGASFAYVRAVSAPGKLPQALGLFGAVIGLTNLILVFVASSLVGINWRIAFAVYAVVSVVCFLLVPIMLPKQPKIVQAGLDVVGQIALGLGIVGLLYGVSQLGSSATSPQTLGPLLIGLALLAFFFIHESRSSKAFYPVRLFRAPLFWAAIMAGLVFNFTPAVTFLQLTNLWQYITDVPRDQIALWQLPLNLFGIIGALVAGRLIGKRLSNGAAILLAGIAVAVGLVLLAAAVDQKSFVAFLPGMALVGFAMTAASIPFGSLILQEAPAAQFGPVSSSRTTIGQVWFSLGTALSTVVIDSITSGGVVRRLTEAGVQPDQISTATSSVTAYVSSGTQPSTQLAREALADATESYSQGFVVVMVATATIVLAAAIIGFLADRRGRHQAASAPAPAPDSAPNTSAPASAPSTSTQAPSTSADKASPPATS